MKPQRMRVANTHPYTRTTRTQSLISLPPSVVCCGSVTGPERQRWRWYAIIFCQFQWKTGKRQLSHSSRNTLGRAERCAWMNGNGNYFGELQTEIGQQISRLVHVIAVDRANMQSIASSGQRRRTTTTTTNNRTASTTDNSLRCFGYWEHKHHTSICTMPRMGRHPACPVVVRNGMNVFVCMCET